MVDEDIKKQFEKEKQYELYKLSQKSPGIAALIGFLIPPIGYIYLGKWAYAAINFFTANYLLLGFFIVPVHCYKIVSDAKKTVAAKEAVSEETDSTD